MMCFQAAAQTGSLRALQNVCQGRMMNRMSRPTKITSATYSVRPNHPKVLGHCLTLFCPKMNVHLLAPTDPNSFDVGQNESCEAHPICSHLFPQSFFLPMFSLVGFFTVAVPHHTISFPLLFMCHYRFPRLDTCLPCVNLDSLLCSLRLFLESMYSLSPRAFFTSSSLLTRGGFLPFLMCVFSGSASPPPQPPPLPSACRDRPRRRLTKEGTQCDVLFSGRRVIKPLS